MRPIPVLCLALCLFLTSALTAAEPLPLSTAQGTIDKVEKDSITVRTRGAGGKFGKSLVLKLTGTTKITTLSGQLRAGKLVATQRETDAKDLQPKQIVTVIYTIVKEDAVLLVAVVQPADDK